MTFLSPAFLWTLLALLPLGAIYFLKVRPRRRTTTAYFLWEKVLSRKRAVSLFQRLRDLLSLLLMAAAFAAAAFALARPEFTADQRRDLFLVIDSSASLSAAPEGGPSHLDEAKHAARDIVAGLDGNQRAAVASVSDQLRYHAHFTRSPRALLDAIEEIEPTDFPLSPRTLEALAGDVLAQNEDVRALFLTDGNFARSTGRSGNAAAPEEEGNAEEAENAETPKNARLPDALEILKIGSPASNAGFADADLRRLPDGNLGFFFRLASSFPEPVEADIVLSHLDEGSGAGRMVKLIPATIVPGENPAEIFHVEESLPGRWTARLNLEDALASDNLAHLALPPRQPIRVAVATENRYFFEASIAAFQENGGLLELVGESESPDLVVEQFTARSEAPLRVVFTPSGNAPPWWESTGDEVEAVAPRVRFGDHPALRHSDLSSIAFLGAREIEIPDTATVLVESETGVPLVYRVATESGTGLVVNLDPLAADFYFSAWFPALIHNAATHLAGRESGTAPAHRPGDILPVPGHRPGQRTTVHLPGGASPVETGEATFGPVETLGFHEMENASGRWPFGVSLLSPAETLLTGEVEDSTEPISRGHAPAYWLLVFAILVLAGESLLYHRRKIG